MVWFSYRENLPNLSHISKNILDLLKKYLAYRRSFFANRIFFCHINKKRVCIGIKIAWYVWHTFFIEKECHRAENTIFLHSVLKFPQDFVLHFFHGGAHVILWPPRFWLWRGSCPPGPRNGINRGKGWMHVHPPLPLRPKYEKKLKIWKKKMQTTYNIRFTRHQILYKIQLTTDSVRRWKMINFETLHEVSMLFFKQI